MSLSSRMGRRSLSWSRRTLEIFGGVQEDKMLSWLVTFSNGSLPRPSQLGPTTSSSKNGTDYIFRDFLFTCLEVTKHVPFKTDNRFPVFQFRMYPCVY